MSNRYIGMMFDVPKNMDNLVGSTLLKIYGALAVDKLDRQAPHGPIYVEHVKLLERDHDVLYIRAEWKEPVQ